jgi:Tfp pilus assembly protein FimV
VLLQQSDAQNAATERALTQERGRRLDLERQLGDARAEIATKAGDLGALQVCCVVFVL